MPDFRRFTLTTPGIPASSKGFVLLSMFKMKKAFAIFLLIFVPVIATWAQPYGNEWIDYQKTYYKFPVRENRFYRIPYNTLNAYGLAGVPAENFQLWRAGKEVPIYTTVPTGPIPVGGYIEFVGQINTGSDENGLFSNPDYQLAPERSFFFDTAWYFLTVNPGAPNKRFETRPNNVASTTQLPDSFYMRVANPLSGATSLNYGYGQYISGNILRSGTWDLGEGFCSSRFDSLRVLEYNLTGLKAFMGGPGFSLEYHVAGINNMNHRALLYKNDILWDSLSIPFFEAKGKVVSDQPMGGNFISDAIKFKFVSPTPGDANVLMKFYLTYPRVFFNDQQVPLIATLPANPQGNHIRFAGLPNGTVPPVLYDLTNNKRYMGVLKGADSSLFAIDGSANERTLAIGTQVATHIRSVSSFKTINFTDFSKTENQGNYLIISHFLLRGGATDQVERYRAYRSGFLGGGYKAKIYDIDELAEQFAYGVRKNPLSIRRFISFAIDRFAEKPKMVYLIGRGGNYYTYLRSASLSAREILNAIPTFGFPPADNLLATRNNMNPVPEIPIGRLAAVNPNEVGVYLDKVIAFENLKRKQPALPSDNEWEKRFLHLVGGDDEFLADSILSRYMQRYANYVVIPKPGVIVDQFSRPNNPDFAKEMRFIENRINEGTGMISYFGHSSTSSIDFNLGSPDQYSNSGGKYPVILANGCRAGNIFDMFTQRIANKEMSISENFTFAKDKGSIAFISNSDLGIINYQNLLTREYYNAFSGTLYGKTIGEIQREALYRAFIRTGSAYFLNRANIEQNILHGDPAIVPLAGGLPDFAVEASMMNTQPTNTLTEQDTVTLKVKYFNIGTAVSDSVWLRVEREMPDGTVKELYAGKKANLFNQDSITIKFGLKGLFEEGNGYLVARIDPGNDWQEQDKDNNVAILPFNLQRRHVTPVFPYNFSILNNNNIELKASTTDPTDLEALYTFQVDTTALFNSPGLMAKDTLAKGGVIGWAPNLTYTPNTVYYWRVARQPFGFNEHTRVFSFSYEPGVKQGFGQSHFFQHLQSTQDQIVPSAHNLWEYKQKEQNIYVAHGVYPYSASEDSHLSITVNGEMKIMSACIGRSIIFNLFDSLTFDLVKNAPLGAYGSADSCNPGREYNFEFRYFNYLNRKLAMDFIDSIPKGTYVAARLILDQPYDSARVNYWKADTAIFGSGKSLYHSLYNQGFYDLDSLNRARTFFFMFRKDDSISYKPYTQFSRGINDRVFASVYPTTVDNKGSITSPFIGPARSWKEINWGFSEGTAIPGDEHSFNFQLWGKTKSGKMELLDEWTGYNGSMDISHVDADTYPFVQLAYHAKDKVGDLPAQLNFWKVYFDGLPDGAWSGNELFSILKTNLKPSNDTLRFQLAFKNVGNLNLSQTRVEVKLDDNQGNISNFYSTALKALAPGDTAILSIDSILSLPEGPYSLLIEANPDGDPNEENYFNNKAIIKLLVEGGPLPLYALKFDALRVGKVSELKWETGEKNIERFRVEHKGEGATTFIVVSPEIPAQSSGLYTWVHVNPTIGTNYYRIRSFLEGGQEKVSYTRAVSFGMGGRVRIAPNPFHEYFTLQPIDNNEKWQARIYDGNSKLVRIENGIGRKQVYLHGVSDGIYWVHYFDGQTTEIHKMMKY